MTSATPSIPKMALRAYLAVGSDNVKKAHIAKTNNIASPTTLPVSIHSTIVRTGFCISVHIRNNYISVRTRSFDIPSTPEIRIFLNHKNAPLKTRFGADDLLRFYPRRLWYLVHRCDSYDLDQQY